MLANRLARLVMVPALALVAMAAAQSPVTYNVDTAHASVAFKIRHNSVADIWGVFTGVTGSIKLEGDSGQFDIVVKASTITTGNEKRDEHLRKNDFFAVAQFPTINFKSTKVVKVDGGYKVTGNLTLHGVTKELTVDFTATDDAKGFQGNNIRGFSSTFTIKRSDFGMKTYLGPVGDDVTLFVSFEAEKQ